MSTSALQQDVQLLEFLLKNYPQIVPHYNSALRRDTEAAKTTLVLYALKIRAIIDEELIAELKGLQSRDQSVCVQPLPRELGGASYALNLGVDQFRAKTGREPLPACTLYAIKTARILIQTYKQRSRNVAAFKDTICLSSTWATMVDDAQRAFQAWQRQNRSQTVPNAVELKDATMQPYLDNVTIDEEMGISDKGDIMSQFINGRTVASLIRWMCTRPNLNPFGVIFTYNGSSSAIVYLPFNGKANAQLAVFDSHGKLVKGYMYCAILEVPLQFVSGSYAPSEAAVERAARFVHEKLGHGANYDISTAQDWMAPSETTFYGFPVEWSQ